MNESPGRQRTRRAILDAATTLLAERGATALTTRAVAERADVQAPAIYRLFGDKEGLLDAVAELVMADHVTEAALDAHRDEASGEDPLLDLRAAFLAHVAFGRAHPDLFWLLHDPSKRGASPSVTSGAGVLRDRIRRIAAAGRLRVSESRAEALLHAAGTGSVLAAAELEASGGRDDGLAEVMFDAVAAVIAGGPEEHDRDPREGEGGVTKQGRTPPEIPGLSAAERGLLAEWVQRGATSSSTE